MPIYIIEMRRNSETDEWQRGPKMGPDMHEKWQKTLDEINADLGWTKYRLVQREGSE